MVKCYLLINNFDIYQWNKKDKKIYAEVFTLHTSSIDRLLEIPDSYLINISIGYVVEYHPIKTIKL
jgi:hypothetical protein